MSGMKVKIVALFIAILGLVGSSALTFSLASSVGANRLAYTDSVVDGDPPQVAAGIAMGAFKGLFVNILWIRANELKEEGKYHEAIELAKAITRLQPRFPRVWIFHAWNMAYNISVVTQTPEERWGWVQAGIRLLRDGGIPNNPNETILYKELAWLYLHKIAGYTDDSSQYYKRKVAEEFQVVVGPPPPMRLAESLARDDVIDLYEAWIAEIASAAETTKGVIDRVPEAEELLEQLELRVGETPGVSLLTRFTYHKALETSPRRDMYLKEMGPKNQAFAELLADPKFEKAWPELVRHTRKRVLVDEYNMDPHIMARFIRQWGPIDWRHPAAHALYWGALGVERGEERYTKESKGLFDFVNTNRVVMQAMQELFRGGEIYFNYVDFVQGGQGFYMAMPDPYFAESYGDLQEQIVRLGGIFEDSTRRAMTPYAAGYENFLTDVIALFYRRGEVNVAEMWLNKLRTFALQTVNDPNKVDEYSKPLDEFVQAQLWDRYESPNIARQEVFGALQGAYSSLLQGDTERFRSMMDYATNAHRYYFEEHYRPMVANRGTARMEYMPKDFPLFAGGVFAQVFQNVPLDEAELLYAYAPDDLKRYAYDILIGMYKPLLDGQAAETGSRNFTSVFPEPPEMESFRAERQRREDAERAHFESLNVEQK